MRVVSIGEVLWDVIDHAEHLGGAPFNFAAHLSKLGHEVMFVSGVGDDPRGQRVFDRMAEMGLSTGYVRRVPGHHTGLVTVTLDSRGQPQFVIHRPAAYDFPELALPQLAELVAKRPEWIYFGTLLQTSMQARRLTATLLDSCGNSRRFYDVNLRPNSYTPALVRELMLVANVVKLNEDEASQIDAMFGRSHASLDEFCRTYASEFGWEAICVTRGCRGCVLLIGEDYVEAPGYAVEVADTVGAGDAFAAAFLHGFASGWPPARIADFADRVGALVAGRSGALPPWTVEEAMSLGTRTSNSVMATPK